MVPLIVTFPVARSVTGVLATFLVNHTVTPLATLMVVKFNTPSRKPPAGTLGSVAAVPLGEYVTVPSFRLTVIPVVPPGGAGVLGGKAPCAPVLPLLNVWAAAGVPARVTRAAPKRRPPRIRRIRCMILTSMLGPPSFAVCLRFSSGAEGRSLIATVAP
jgi:hypothetical protein